MATIKFVPGLSTVTPQPSADVAARIDAAISAVDALNMEVLTTHQQLADHLRNLRRGRSTEVLLCEFGGGILDFIAAAFPNLGAHVVFAQHFSRDPRGRGAHFDVYGELLDEAFPWVAVFNIAGDAALSTFVLPQDLARRYLLEHPVPSDAAFEARRQVAAEALARGVHLSKGMLSRHREGGFARQRPERGGCGCLSFERSFA